MEGNRDVVLTKEQVEETKALSELIRDHLNKGTRVTGPETERLQKYLDELVALTG